MSERIVVSVDFGTTFTGVAAVHTSDPDDIQTIKTWPGGYGLSSEKVPSVFLYDEATAAATPIAAATISARETNEKTGELSLRFPKLFAPKNRRYETRRVRWGYQVRAHEDCIRYMKLLLDKHQKFPDFVLPGRMLGNLESADRGIMDAVTDYLTAVHEHAKSQLVARWTSLLVATSRIQYVLTVPAVWSDAAKDSTRLAATRAGMGADLRLISEPEAAAVHTIHAMRANACVPGQNILVGDCGGGTVDLITYRITQVKPTLKVEESVAGTGGLCGSAFLDVRFETLVERKLGKQHFDHIRSNRPKAWPAALQDFESSHKRQFSLETDQTVWFIKFPGVADDPDIGIDEGHLILSLEEMTSIFDPVIDDAIRLFDEQFAKVRAHGESISAIILVGGFGQSPYLHERLRKHLAIPQSPDYISAADTEAGRPVFACPVEIIRPPNGWSAVVMGAARRGVEETFVTSRRYRQHLGIITREKFNPAIHEPWQRYWNRYADCWYAKSVMRWIIPKDEQIPNERTFSIVQILKHWDDGVTTHGIELWACQDDVAPKAMLDGSSDRASSLRPYCTIVSDISKVPESRWVLEKNKSGTVYYRLPIEIEIKIDSAEMLCTLKVGDVSYGSVNKSFDD